jgi:hypothetical protein
MPFEFEFYLKFDFYNLEFKSKGFIIISKKGLLFQGERKG